jgi:hypothetical protein
VQPPRTIEMLLTSNFMGVDTNADGASSRRRRRGGGVKRSVCGSSAAHRASVEKRLADIHMALGGSQVQRGVATTCSALGGIRACLQQYSDHSAAPSVCCPMQRRHLGLPTRVHRYAFGQLSRHRAKVTTL